MLETNPRFTPSHFVLLGERYWPVGVTADHVAASPVATLQKLYNARASDWDIVLRTNKPKLKVFQDSITLSVTSERSGFLYILYVSSDNREFTYLYPRDPGDRNQLRAGVPFIVPYSYASTGPVGTNHILAIVSPDQRDFSNVFTHSQTADASRQTTCEIAKTMNTRGFSVRKCVQNVATQGMSLQGPEPLEQSGGLVQANEPQGAANTYGANLLEVVEE
jgi:hypothetical protein